MNAYKVWIVPSPRQPRSVQYSRICVSAVDDSVGFVSCATIELHDSRKRADNSWMQGRPVSRDKAAMEVS